jgi:hypothetical protein
MFLHPLTTDRNSTVIKTEKCKDHQRNKINYDMFGHMFFKREWMVTDKRFVECSINKAISEIKKDIEYVKKKFNIESVVDLEYKYTIDYCRCMCGGFVTAGPTKEEFNRFLETGRSLYFNPVDGYVVKVLNDKK